MIPAGSSLYMPGCFHHTHAAYEHSTAVSCQDHCAEHSNMINALPRYSKKLLAVIIKNVLDQLVYTKLLEDSPGGHGYSLFELGTVDGQGNALDQCAA